MKDRNVEERLNAGDERNDQEDDCGRNAEERRNDSGEENEGNSGNEEQRERANEQGSGNSGHRDQITEIGRGNERAKKESILGKIQQIITKLRKKRENNLRKMWRFSLSRAWS